MRVYLGTGNVGGTPRGRALGDGETKAAIKSAAEPGLRLPGQCSFLCAELNLVLPKSILMSRIMGSEKACGIITSMELPGKRPMGHLLLKQSKDSFVSSYHAD